MNDIDLAQLDKLEALASAATPGPWQVITDEHPTYAEGYAHKERRIFTAAKNPQLGGIYPVVNSSRGIGEQRSDPAIWMVSIEEANAAFIAAANPATVQQLIALARRSLTSGAPDQASPWFDSAMDTGVLPDAAPVHDAAAPSNEQARFYMDHGVWHDRVTGQHMWTQDQYDEQWRDMYRAGQEHAAIGYSMLVSSAGAGAKSEQAPMQLCPRCQGSGEGKMMVGGGPDAYEIDSNCSECGGIGEVSATAAGAGSAQPRAEGDEREIFETTMGAGILADQGEFALSRAYSEGRPYTFLATVWAWKAWQARAALDQGAQTALLKLCDQLDAMKRTMFLCPGTGQHYSYLVYEDVQAYVEQARATLTQQAGAAAPSREGAATTASASSIKTWQERVTDSTPVHLYPDAMRAEIADLRAALARAPLPAQPK